MNFKMLAPLVGAPMAAFIVNGENVLKKALSTEQHSYLLKNWQTLPVWLGTEEGQIALQTIMQDWMASQPPEIK